MVGVECFRNRPFCIIGEVANPGCYPYVRGMRFIDAIAMAGGFTYRGKEDECIAINTRADVDGKQECAGREALVMPGDVIEVPERFF